jgi:hypothetical protein
MCRPQASAIEQRWYLGTPRFFSRPAGELDRAWNVLALAAALNCR